MRAQFTREARTNVRVIEFNPVEEDPLLDAMTQDARGFPCPLSEGMGFPGAILYPRLTLDAYFRTLLATAQIRQGSLPRVARAFWGLGTTILKFTRAALLTCLLRYGLVLTGSCIPDDLLNKLDAQLINVAARKLPGLPMITRVEALHFILGTHSIRNLYGNR